ncbi:sensor histidine kinase [Chamaesiphon sp.]|uniref:sensor histidine kinase n=1 Tax=Chamaesiphon sp. TaxID=2814140 RepID=UPI0035941EA5
MKIEFLTRHPLRLLLYIEWILFAVVMALEVAPRDGQFLEPKWLNIGIVALVAVMGLRLPSGSGTIGVLYMIAQIIPILIAAAVGMRPVAWLYLIVVIRSYLIFGRQYRLWITAGIFALYLTTLNLFPSSRRYAGVKTRVSDRTEIATSESQSSTTRTQYGPNQRDRSGFRWGFVFLFGGALLSLQLLVDRILAEKLAKEELAIANQRIRTYALKAEEYGSIQERNRIAREIHDSLGHSLTALNLHLEMAVKLAHLKPETSREVLIEAKRLGSIALRDVRQSVSTLRSDPLHNQDLQTALYKLADEFKLSNQIRPACYVNVPPDLPSPVAVTIYRIVQEALTNISKYAEASEVEIEIRTLTTEIALRITDDGVGFIPTNNATGFGLQGMRERVLSLQGKFELVSKPSAGCQIVAVIPLISDYS